MNIKFSIVLPAYNTPPNILSRAIESVLNQTYPYFELIVVDDGSIPSLEPIVKTYNDNRIVFIRHSENKGAGAAHNTGIKAAKYNWIAFICHDDEWLPNKLEISKPIIEKESSNYKFYFHLPIVIGEKDQINKFLHFNNCKPYTGNYYFNFLIGYDLCIQTSTIIIHKDCFEKIGYYDESGVLIDWDLYLRLSQKFDFYYIDYKLSKYYYSPLGITHINSIIKNPIKNAKAGNDTIKLFFKWKNEILKHKLARKAWSKRLNYFLLYNIKNNSKNKILKLYLQAIRLYPYWRGNYIDLVKYILNLWFLLLYSTIILLH